MLTKLTFPPACVVIPLVVCPISLPPPAEALIELVVKGNVHLTLALPLPLLVT